MSPRKPRPSSGLVAASETQTTNDQVAGIYFWKHLEAIFPSKTFSEVHAAPTHLHIGDNISHPSRRAMSDLPKNLLGVEMEAFLSCYVPVIEAFAFIQV